MKARIFLIAVISALVAMWVSAPASADTTPATPEQILSSLAQDQTHSWVDDGIGFPAMLAKYEAGERLYVTCGNVAEIGRELLATAGYTSRVVQVITNDSFDYTNDGHLMLEVWEDGRWQLWDLDANQRAVDANGNGVSLVEQVAAVQAGDAHWQQIADDPLWNPDESDPAHLALAERVFSDPAAFYQRVMGVALLPGNADGTDTGPMLYGDSAAVTHLSTYPGWRRLATADEWTTLTTTADPLPQPVIAPITLVPEPPPTPPPAPKVAAPPPPPVPVLVTAGYYKTVVVAPSYLTRKLTKRGHWLWRKGHYVKRNHRRVWVKAKHKRIYHPAVTERVWVPPVYG